MKKLLVLIACALCAGQIMAGDYFPVKLTVAAAGTTATADIDLSTTFGDKAMFVERVTAACISGGGTGVVTFASIDHGIATTVATSDSVSLAAANAYSGYPARTVSDSVLVRNIVVTNDVPILVLSTNTVATSQQYLLKTVRVTVTQLANPVATVYNAVIFVK
jgi:hypothetical protein